MKFKNNFSFLLKSYHKDISYVNKLVESFDKYNIDSINLYIVIPRNDIEFFNEYKNKINTVLLLEDDILKEHLVSNGSNNLSPGYINQQIVKLSFWETKLSKSYLCLDSDFVFIRDFYYSDFLNESGDPYLFLDHENDLNTDGIYFKYYQTARLNKLNIISERLNLKFKNLLNVHNSQTFNSEILKQFHEEFLLKNNLGYSDLLSISPYEFSWYNFWVQKTQKNNLLYKPSLVKFFHMDYQYVFSLMITDLKDLRRSYIGIVLNTTWSRKNRINKYGQVSLRLIFNVFKKILLQKLFKK